MSSLIHAKNDCALSSEHELDLVLCAELEVLADGLPRLPPAATLRRLTERLDLAARRWCDRRWEGLPAMQQADEARLLDAMTADDIVSILWTHWREPDAGHAGKLAYMLRSLFDGRRRAIALEISLLGCADCQSSAIA